MSYRIKKLHKLKAKERLKLKYEKEKRKEKELLSILDFDLRDII